jgi:hypothetical protein
MHYLTSHLEIFSYLTALPALHTTLIAAYKHTLREEEKKIREPIFTHKFSFSQLTHQVKGYTI